MNQDMDKGEKVFILQSANREIINECIGWDGVETGTVLVGCQVPNGYLITKALPPGPGAKRSGASFSPDVNHVQKDLHSYRIQYPGEDFLGIQHQHPGWLAMPSSGDWHQVMEILKDRDYKINGRFLSVISIRQNSKIRIFPYQITDQEQTFRLLPLHILPDADPQVAALRRQSLFLTPKKVAQASPVSFWDDHRFQWHRTPAGRARLEKEIQGIQGVIKPQIIQTADGTLIMQAKRLIVIFPAEYPLNPPRFFKQGKKELIEIKESPLLYFWNSSLLLTDVITMRPYKKYLKDNYIVRLIMPSFNKVMREVRQGGTFMCQYIYKFNPLKQKEEDDSHG